MADVPEGNFTHTLEYIDAGITEVENTKGQAESLTAAVESIASDAASTAAASAIADLDVASSGGSGRIDLSDLQAAQCIRHCLGKSVSAMYSALVLKFQVLQILMTIRTRSSVYITEVQLRTAESVIYRSMGMLSS